MPDNSNVYLNGVTNDAATESKLDKLSKRVDHVDKNTNSRITSLNNNAHDVMDKHRKETDDRIDALTKRINNLVVWFVCGSVIGVTGFGLATIALSK